MQLMKDAAILNAAWLQLSQTICGLSGHRENEKGGSGVWQGALRVLPDTHQWLVAISMIAPLRSCFRIESA